MKSESSVLVVDLDGTLIKTDLLLECFLKYLKAKPFLFWLPFFWLFTGGKVGLKRKLSDRVKIDYSSLPYCNAVLKKIREAKADNNKIVLATASYVTLADGVAAHLKLFDEVYSTEDVNLSSSNKANCLIEAFDDRPFAYIGNSSADLAVWAKAHQAYVVNADTSLIRKAKTINANTEVLAPKPSHVWQWIKAIRPHQWAKNMLVFLPILAAQQIGFNTSTLNVLIGFLSFSLCASSVYLLNDLLDVEDDRHHHKKNRRPFAAGTLGLGVGLFSFPILLSTSAVLAFIVSPEFLGVLVVYWLITTAYSFQLKKVVLLDVFTLAILYTMRIFAGTVAANVLPSDWLFAFSIFLFLSLAILKRYSELIAKREVNQNEKIRGRGYHPEDLEMLSSLGGASGYVAALVLALYISSEKVQLMYSHPEFLWGANLVVLYWNSRIWLLAHRGKVHDDPVVYALKDKVSRYTVFVAGIFVLLAAYGEQIYAFG
ncbi:MAG: UbiA family prenyltransferase [Cyanobacteria bacterium P01_F01_bin.86]